MKKTGQMVNHGNPSRRVRKRRKRQTEIQAMIRRRASRRAELEAIHENLTEDEREYGRIIELPQGGWRRVEL